VDLTAIRIYGIKGKRGYRGKGEYLCLEKGFYGCPLKSAPFPTFLPFPPQNE